MQMNASEATDLTAAIASVTGAETALVMEAILPLLDAIITERVTADRRHVLDQVNRFRTQMKAHFAAAEANAQEDLSDLLSAC